VADNVPRDGREPENAARLRQMALRAHKLAQDFAG
jgi:hypothetical protein